MHFLPSHRKVLFGLALLGASGLFFQACQHAIVKTPASIDWPDAVRILERVEDNSARETAFREALKTYSNGEYETSFIYKISGQIRNGCRKIHPETINSKVDCTEPRFGDGIHAAQRIFFADENQMAAFRNALKPAE